MEVLKATIYPVIVMGGLAALFALGLGIAARVFYVYIDPRIGQIEELLGGANCGGCGYAGCSDCAEAIVAGKAPVNACILAPMENIKQIAEIMGVTVEEEEEKKVARIMCRGTPEKAKRRFQYMGIDDCRAAILVAGGDKDCEYGCLGYGTCVKSCPFGAMSMGRDGLPKVDEEKCVGCGTCVRVCPRGVPHLLPVSQKVYVPCNSHDAGKIVKAICEVGCQGCGICRKNCPEKAIIIDKFLSIVDPKKCIGPDASCGGKCMDKCPTGAIQRVVA